MTLNKSTELLEFSSFLKLTKLRVFDDEIFCSYSKLHNITSKSKTETGQFFIRVDMKKPEAVAYQSFVYTN